MTVEFSPGAHHPLAVPANGTNSDVTIFHYSSSFTVCQETNRCAGSFFFFRTSWIVLPRRRRHLTLVFITSSSHLASQFVRTATFAITVTFRLRQNAIPSFHLHLSSRLSRYYQPQPLLSVPCTDYQHEHRSVPSRYPA